MNTIVSFSLLGIAAMTPVSLLQLGVVRHLPDPPIPGFDSDRVNLSQTASVLGVPDGPISLASFVVNLPAARLLDPVRHPRLTIAFGAKAAIEAVVAGWYFAQMPRRERAWCGYCIAAFVGSVGVLAATIPRVRRAARRLRSQASAARAPRS